MQALKLYSVLIAIRKSTCMVYRIYHCITQHFNHCFMIEILLPRVFKVERAIRIFAKKTLTSLIMNQNGRSGEWWLAVHLHETEPRLVHRF